MKHVWFVVLAFAVLSGACGKKEPTGPSTDYSAYFPLDVNYKWYFYYPQTPTATVIYRIWGTQTIDGKLYYQYGNKAETSDLFRKDAHGNVFKKRPAGEVLWFNFDTADGGNYQVKLSDKFIYTVTVAKNQTVTYDGRTFTDCVIFSFDALNLTDEEIRYTIAPEVGIVQMIGAYVTLYLDSYEF